MKKIDIIQVLRGIAALLVVGFHSADDFDHFHRGLGRVFSSGNIGVDLFFIISGFIMIYVTGERTGGKVSAKFMINRISRVLPLYFIISLVYVLITHAYVIFNEPADPRFKIHPVAFVKDMFFIPADLHGEAPFFGYAPLTVGWTLHFEMFFYLLFGLSLLFGSFRLWFLYGIFAILLFVIPIATGHFSLDAATHKEYAIPYLNFATNPMLLEFVIGMVIAYIYMSGLSIPLWAALGLAICGVLFFLGQYFTEFQTSHGPFHWGLSCSLLIFSLLMLHKAQPIRVPGFLVFLGDISYSVYLVHKLVEFVLTMITMHFRLPAYHDTIAYFPLYLGLVIAGSYITYYLIEQRLSNYIRLRIMSWLKL